MLRLYGADGGRGCLMDWRDSRLGRKEWRWTDVHMCGNGSREVGQCHRYLSKEPAWYTEHEVDALSIRYPHLIQLI